MNEELSLAGINTDIQDIAQKVLDESDTSKTKELIALFNWNLSKKNVVRSLKLNDLYDDITDQMVKRVTSKPDQVSNSDLLDYMKTVQGAIAHADKAIDSIQEPPAIIQNNTQVNINVIDSFDRESRARILAAVQATLKAASAQPQDYEDKTEGDIQTNESI